MKFSGILPSIDELAEVMEPQTKEALAPITDMPPLPEELEFSKSKTAIRDKRGVEIVAPVRDLDIVKVSQKGNIVKVEIDFVNKAFARTLRWFCNVGLAIIILSAVFYFAGVNPYDDLNLEVAKWNEPAAEFWHDVKGTTAHGYSWFMSSLNDPESVVVAGITVLALAPLAGFMIAIPGTKGALRILLLVISAEFVYAIIRPLIMVVSGGH